MKLPRVIRVVRFGLVTHLIQCINIREHFRSALGKSRSDLGIMCAYSSSGLFKPLRTSVGLIYWRVL
jgi:hypothetical protein